MTSNVYYGSPLQARIGAEETLPAKLDLILAKLHLPLVLLGDPLGFELFIAAVNV